MMIGNGIIFFYQTFNGAKFSLVFQNVCAGSQMAILLGMIFYFWVQRRRGVIFDEPQIDESDPSIDAVEPVNVTVERQPLLLNQDVASDEVLPWAEDDGLQVRLRDEANKTKWSTY